MTISHAPANNRMRRLPACGIPWLGFARASPTDATSEMTTAAIVAPLTIVTLPTSEGYVFQGSAADYPPWARVQAARYASHDGSNSTVRTVRTVPVAGEPETQK
jgi:hypothetical protein